MSINVSNHHHAVAGRDALDPLAGHQIAGRGGVDCGFHRRDGFSVCEVQASQGPAHVAPGYQG